MDSVYIVMPAYNEEQNIESVVKEWYAVLEDKGENSRLVVADSGSTDQTHEILQELQLVYPRLDVINNTDKQHGQKGIWRQYTGCQRTVQADESRYSQKISL